MRDGQAIVRRLGGRRIKNGWKFSCPCHRDRNPSAVIYDSGWIVCFAKCDRKEIETALDALGLKDNGQPAPARDRDKERADREQRVKEVQQLWEDQAPDSRQWWAEDFDRVDPLRPQGDDDIALVAQYLKWRGITLPVPIVLRRWAVNGLIACLQQIDGTITAVQTRSARGDRLTHGPMENGAVRLTPLKNEHLALSEGIETSLAVTQLFQIPCWASLGAERLHNIAIPPGIRVVHLFGDSDEVGRKAVAKAGRTYQEQGYEVRWCVPDMAPAEGKDWNDFLKRLANAEE